MKFLSLGVVSLSVFAHSAFATVIAKDGGNNPISALSKTNCSGEITDVSYSSMDRSVLMTLNTGCRVEFSESDAGAGLALFQSIGRDFKTGGMAEVGGKVLIYSFTVSK